MQIITEAHANFTYRVKESGRRGSIGKLRSRHVRQTRLKHDHFCFGRQPDTGHHVRPARSHAVLAIPEPVRVAVVPIDPNVGRGNQEPIQIGTLAKK